MTESALESRISERLVAAGVVAAPSVVADCAVYLGLLTRWNRKINLTSLPLVAPLPDNTVDKLIVEPLQAALLFPADTAYWIDLGTGGGSPAIPLRIANRGGSMTMVESRERKCAFLQEVVRTLHLERTTAQAVRFENVAVSTRADVVTLRAVRVDQQLVDLLERLLRVGGLVFCFGSAILGERFESVSEAILPDGSSLFVQRRRG